MLKKIIMVMFIGVISATSVSAFAVTNSSKNVVIVADNSLVPNSLAISDIVDNHEVIKPANSGRKDNVATQTSENDGSFPATGWLLFLALIGFVMLSDRRGV